MKMIAPQDVCCICKKKTVSTLLNLGEQAVASRFLRTDSEVERSFPLVFGYCQSCGLAQLVKTASSEMLQPSYHWISYNEPGRHLDQLADDIGKLPGVDSDSLICGLSSFDLPMLDKLSERGLNNVFQVDPVGELEIDAPIFGVETIQHRLIAQVEKIVEKRGRPDVVVASFILEHAHDMSRFLNSLRDLVSPQGYVIVSVPDCKRSFALSDYTVIWEEHISYFTSETLVRSLAYGGFDCRNFYDFTYTLADCLVGVFQPRSDGEAFVPVDLDADNESAIVESFAANMPTKTKYLQDFLQRYKRDKKKIAVLGAGHMSCTFINLLGAYTHLECVVDDDPNKQNLYMPGSRLPILGSGALCDNDIDLCLLALNPDIETKVIEGNRGYIERGGSFMSIFPQSERFFEYG
jgi:hypothetical protein